MFKIGDRVQWRFQNGLTYGIITRKHTEDFVFMGKQRRATEQNPQYEVMSEKTGKNAVHKPCALKKI